jgi:nucleotide-binding universal stress UspA family protein
MPVEQLNRAGPGRCERWQDASPPEAEPVEHSAFDLGARGVILSLDSDEVHHHGSNASKGLPMNAELKNDGPSPLSLIVGLAFGDADGAAFDQAARLALRVPRSELHLVHVFEAKEPSAAQEQDLLNHLRLYVNEKATLAGGLKAITVGIHLRAGKPVREIVQLATELHADLIVIGSHKGPHLKSWLVGSTAEHLVASAPCAVLVASPRPRVETKHDPVIEPPCPDCLRSRKLSHGGEWWCERHAHHAKQAHAFSYQRELPFETHDSEVIPTGIKF